MYNLGRGDLYPDIALIEYLTALPLKQLGFIFNKQEFRDAIALRYNWCIPAIPKFCGCGENNDIVHILSCKKGGYVSMKDNSSRETMVNLMKEAGCSDVQIEPPLLPSDELSGSGWV